MRKQYYIEVDTDQAGAVVVERLTAALEFAGFAVGGIEEACKEYNGVVYMEDALKDIWSVESGAEYCNRPVVEGKPPHKEWVELTDEQRAQFIAKLTTWTADQRYEHFDLSRHDREGVFGGVAVECHQHERPHSWERGRDEEE